MPPTSSADDEHQVVLDKLALLALTYEIDQWNNESPKVAEKYLSDADQNFLSKSYVAHLIPIARGSIWWNDDNARLARTVLLPERYPVLATKAWKRNQGKTRGILRTWRRDAARIFPELTEDGYGDYETDDEEYDLPWQPARNKKRKGDAIQEDARKNYKKPNVSRSESPEVDHLQEARKTANTPFRPKPHAPATGLVTPPQSTEGTPVAGSDSDSEDGEPIPMRRRRARPPITPTRSPLPGSAAAAAAYPSPLSISPTRTMASIAPVAASGHGGGCLVTFENALEVLNRAQDEKEKQSNRRLAELGKCVKQLAEMVAKLTEKMNP